MPRSKSAGRKSSKSSASKSGGFDLSDPNIKLGIQVGVLAALVVAFTGDGTDPMAAADKDNWFAFFSGDGPSLTVAGVNLGGLLLFLHVLNVCNSNGSGAWYSALLDCTFGAYGSWVVADVLSGSAPSILDNTAALNTLVIGYLLTNWEIPQAGFTVYGKVDELVGNYIGLQSLLNMASLVWSVNYSISAASGAGNIYKAVVVACACACAGDFFPLSKGISVSDVSADMERAFWIAFLIGTNGLSDLPVVGSALGDVATTACKPLGGLNNTIVGVVVLNELFGRFLPLNPLDSVKDAFFGVTGLSR